MFLSNTQKELIIDELKGFKPTAEWTKGSYVNIDDVVKSIVELGSESNYLEWTDPDRQQIAIRLSDEVWLYSENDDIFYDIYKDSERDVENYKVEILDWRDYSEDEHDSYSPNGSLKEVKKMYPSNWVQMALENIFEGRTDSF